MNAAGQRRQASSDPVDIAIVMPVYNEEASISDVLLEWREALRELGVSFHFLLVDDGSTDRTPEILDQCRSAADLTVITQPNRGHGAACRAGYEQALRRNAKWILQIDSDGQCDPVYLRLFWKSRLGADCVFGERRQRDDGILRTLVSWGCSLAVSCLMFRRVRDANVPYRLISAAALRRALRVVPADFEMQNVGVAAALHTLPDVELRYQPIRFRVRRGGRGSLGPGRMFRMGYRMGFDLMRMRP